MAKRTTILGTYDTAAQGWTLNAWELTPAEEKTYFVDIPGGDGSLDLSTALTDGVPKFKDRTLTIVLIRSDGDRASRETAIRNLVRELHAQRKNIQSPDDTSHYLVGRIHVARDFNTPAYAQVTVTVICEPWRYKNAETKTTLSASSTSRTATLTNNGDRVVVPTLTVSGSSVNLTFGTATIALSSGTYQWADLLLKRGSNSLTYKGSGSVTITYREAVLE